MLYEKWVTDEIKEEIKRFLKSMNMKTQPRGTYGIQQRQS
jgi:hypothetical protein